jgi:hypothetical protein
MLGRTGIGVTVMAATTYTTVDEVAAVNTGVRNWLRFEGAVAFIAGLALYGWLGGDWAR